MNKILKKVLSVSLLYVVISQVLFNYSANAEVTESNIIIEGNAEGLVTIPETEDFLQKDKMLPGDEVKGTIKLQNNYDYEYEVFLRAEDSEKKSDISLINMLDLKLSIDGKSIYNGILNGNGQMDKDISLGIIKPGESKTIDASVVLNPEKTGNEYKNKYASIEWIFTAVREEEKEGPPIELPQEPEKTGDNNSIIWLVGALGLSTTAIIVLSISRKRRGKNEI
ncbi:MAG: hypothetical protein MR274_09470 [Clostridium sp.]|nr:hypothetical protein [Clostridium sp.]MDY3827658.1 hypothetical protein [Clostridium sp.]